MAEDATVRSAGKKLKIPVEPGMSCAEQLRILSAECEKEGGGRSLALTEGQKDK